MAEEIAVEIYGKAVSDFQLRRLMRACDREYPMPITAFISDAVIVEDTCLGISFGHTERDDAPYKADGVILRTGKIYRAMKAGRYWLLKTREGNYVVSSFMREVGRQSFLQFLRTADQV